MTFIILNCDFNTFYQKFPYICYSPKSENMKLNKQSYPNQILNDELFLGNIDHATSKEILKNLKITHILNITMQNNAFEHDKELNIDYLHCPIFDGPSQPISIYFEKGINFINNALIKNNTNNNNQIINRVLVHCQAGISRSSTMIIAYLMKIHKMTYDDAYQYTQKRREIIQPNYGFIQQLKLYEQNGCMMKNDHIGLYKSNL